MAGLAETQKKSLLELSKGKWEFSAEYLQKFKKRTLEALEESVEDIVWIFEVDKSKKIFTDWQNRNILGLGNVLKFIDLFTSRNAGSALQISSLLAGKISNDNMIDLVKKNLDKKQFHRLFVDILDQKAAVKLFEDLFPTARVTLEIGAVGGDLVPAAPTTPIKEKVSKNGHFNRKIINKGTGERERRFIEIPKDQYEDFKVGDIAQVGKVG